MEYLEPEVGTFQIRGRLVRGMGDAGREHQPARRSPGLRRDHAMGDRRPAGASTMGADVSRKSSPTLT
jgi:hypothetical protein